MCARVGFSLRGTGEDCSLTRWELQTAMALSAEEGQGHVIRSLSFHPRLPG